MISFLNTYQQRKKEINDFLEMMKFMENKQFQKDENDIPEFDNFFHEGDYSISLTYQEMVNIFKSNMLLMLYNIIEFTVTNLMESIYDEIIINKLSYRDVNEFIRTLWKKAILKTTNDPNANFNTFLKKNDQIINEILENNIIELSARKSLPAGNLDGYSIVETFGAHGIVVKTSSKNFRPDILDAIKKQRNDLAHGSVSFVDADRDDTIQDIEKYREFVFNFLQELIDTVSEYIDQNKYRIMESVV